MNSCVVEYIHLLNPAWETVDVVPAARKGLQDPLLLAGEGGLRAA